MPSDLFNPVDKTSKSIPTINYIEKNINEGNCYSFNSSGIASISTTTTTIQTSFIVGNKKAKVQVKRQATASFTVKLYKNPVITSAGTILQSTNRNTSSIKTAEMIIHGGSIVSDISSATLLGTDAAIIGTNGVCESDSNGKLDAIWVLDKNETYLSIVTFSAACSYFSTGMFIEEDE